MSDATPALDEAFERMAAASFELPNGFVNHGAMACEALAMLDCAGDIDSWARRFARAGGAPVDPVVPSTRSTRRRGAVSWPGRWVTGRPATEKGSRSARCRPPGTCGWRS